MKGSPSARVLRAWRRSWPDFAQPTIRMRIPLPRPLAGRRRPVRNKPVPRSSRTAVAGARRLGEDQLRAGLF